MFTKAFSFRKVGFLLIKHSVFPLIIRYKRIYDDSECMVRQMPNHLYIYLKMFQGDLA